MKRIIVLVFAIIVVFLAGCTDTAHNIVLEETSSSKVTETSTPEVEPLWSTTVAFDKNNKIDFYVNKEEPTKLYSTFNFDGENTPVEYSRVLSAIAVAGEYGFGQNLFFVIRSGENSGIVSFGKSYKWELPTTYIECDDNITSQTIAAIRSALSEHIDK